MRPTPAARRAGDALIVLPVVVLLLVAGSLAMDVWTLRVSTLSALLALQGAEFVAVAVLLVLYCVARRTTRGSIDRLAALEHVLTTALELRAHRTPQELLSAAARAARSLTGAATATAYHLATPTDTRLRRISTSARRPSSAPGTLTLGAGRGDIRPSGTGDVHDLLIPITYEDDEPLAALVLSGCAAAPTDAVRDALRMLSSQVAIALHSARLHQRALAQAQEDAVTGLANFRAFVARLSSSVSRACRQGGPVSLLLIDLDNFAVLNAARGYQAADAVLLAVAGALRTTLGNRGVLARTGADEFAVLTDLDTPARVRALGRELQRAIAGVRVLHHETSLGITASIGAALAPEHGTSATHLLHAAARALVAAQAAGTGSLALPEEVSDLRRDDPASLATELASSHLATLEALAAAVDAKDHYTCGHSRRVAAYAAALADAMGLPAGVVARVRRAGDLHDIGKIGIPDVVLLKEGTLSEDERIMLQEHAVIGERMLAAVPFLRELLPAVRHHHERWDGRGYPDGLAGTTIPIDAAILGVVDAFDAMTTTRTYRRALSTAEACRRLASEAGSQFDPRVVGVFMQAIYSRKILPLVADVPADQRRRYGLRRKFPRRRRPSPAVVSVRHTLREAPRVASRGR